MAPDMWTWRNAQREETPACYLSRSSKQRFWLHLGHEYNENHRNNRTLRRFCYVTESIESKVTSHHPANHRHRGLLQANCPPTTQNNYCLSLTVVWLVSMYASNTLVMAALGHSWATRRSTVITTRVDSWDKNGDRRARKLRRTGLYERGPSLSKRGNNCHTRADTAALVISLKCLVQHTYRPLKVFSAIIRMF